MTSGQTYSSYKNIDIDANFSTYTMLNYISNVKAKLYKANNVPKAIVELCTESKHFIK